MDQISGRLTHFPVFLTSIPDREREAGIRTLKKEPAGKPCYPRLLSLVYILIFLKRNPPATVIASAKPPITARQTTGLIWDTPVRPYRIPSTPYVRGSKRVIGAIHDGSELMGKSAPDSPNIGKITKFMISWKPVISSILDAMAIPKAVKEIPISTMNNSAI